MTRSPNEGTYGVALLLGLAPCGVAVSVATVTMPLTTKSPLSLGTRALFALVLVLLGALAVLGGVRLLGRLLGARRRRVTWSVCAATAACALAGAIAAGVVTRSGPNPWEWLIVLGPAVPGIVASFAAWWNPTYAPPA